MKYKLIRTDTYNSLLRCIDKALQNNHELRKICQCRQCKHGEMPSPKTEWSVCGNKDSDNYGEFRNPYSSCEKCERR